MPPDRFNRPLAIAGTDRTRPRVTTAALASLVLGLAGCASAPGTGGPAVAAGPSCANAASTTGLPGGALGAELRAGAASAGSDSGTAGTCAVPVTVDPADAWAMKFLLGYAERLNGLSTAELASEITSLGEPGQQPMGQMQLALALTHTHQAVDTARALGLFQRVVAHTAAGAAPYKPLARLMVARLMDQRRLEEAADKQNQQLREQQRRIDQLTERLEAMRAIERSLNSRPGTAPGGRGIRPPAAP